MGEAVAEERATGPPRWVEAARGGPEDPSDAFPVDPTYEEPVWAER